MMRRSPTSAPCTGAFQRIGLIDFADQPRPRSLGTGSELGAWLLAWRRPRGTGVRRCFLCPLTACPVLVPAEVANEVLVAIRKVLAQQRQPLAHPASLGSSASTREASSSARSPCPWRRRRSSSLGTSGHAAW